MTTGKGADNIRKVTSELSDELLREQLNTRPDIRYYPIPNAVVDPDQPVWRIRLDLTFDSHLHLGLDVNGEVILGRNQEGEVFAELAKAVDVEQFGVSRKHALLRPADSKLFVLDLGSTNGTWLNGRSIGVNMPASLNNGDLLRLGRLEFTVNIIKRPGANTAPSQPNDPNEIFIEIARAITSQLEMDGVLRQAMEVAIRHTNADEITIWLVDEHSGQLFLEAGRGLHDEMVQRLSVNDTLAGKVLKTGKAVRAHRQREGEQIKIKTGYLVEAVLYVPLHFGGTTFGVLSAAHRKTGRSFSDQDERLMTIIGDLMAVSVHNARVYESAYRSSNRRGKIITAMHSALTLDMKNLINSTIGYSGLLQSSATDPELAEMALQVTENGNNMAVLLARLTEAAALSDELVLERQAVDLTDVVDTAVNDMRAYAESKTIRLSHQSLGNAYVIYGDVSYLYRSVLHLIDNAIKFTPERGQVSIELAYSHHDILIRVMDTGPGIPDEDLPLLFERYYRDTPTSDGRSGIGLGLEFVRSTVEAHRGSVSVRNGDDGGAEFLITLPSRLRA